MKSLLIAAGMIAFTTLTPISAAEAATNCGSLEIIAHRGYHNAKIDEESLTAFSQAATRGYSIETDVWPDADGNLWIFHDRNVKRITGVDENIDQMTTSEVAALRTLRTGSPIPSLSDALALFANYPSTRVYIEVKVRSTTDQVAQMIRAAGVTSHTYITSNTAYVHQTEPDLNLLLKTYQTTPDPTTLLAQGIEIVAFQPAQMTSDTVAQYHSAGIQIQDRTSNSVNEWATVIQAGADGVLTDFPDKVRQYCSPSAPPTLSSFSPTSGPEGTTVSIVGSGFTGATSVQFGSVSAAFTVQSDTQIDVVVPSAAPVSAKIRVTTPAGSVLSGQAFRIPPTITGFTPTGGAVGTTVTITGSDFTGAKSVQFGTVAAAFTVDSPTQITTTVPATAPASSVIHVTTPGGSVASSQPFAVG